MTHSRGSDVKFNDMFLGLLLVAAAIAIWISAQNFSRLPNQDYGSETMPLALSVLAFGLGGFLVVRAALAGQRMPRVSRPEWADAPGAVTGLLIAIALIVGYIVLAGQIGFIPVAIVLVLILMLVMGVDWRLALLLAVVSAVVVQQAFARLLLVPLPRSGFLPFLW